MSQRILLVDDEETLRLSLAYTLNKEGFEVTGVEDGRGALSAMADGPFDLVLLDLMLPGIDGVEVCRRLREQSTVPVIMLTARDQVLDKVLGLEAGADDYVTKPFSSHELLARIRAVLRRVQPEAEVAPPTGVLTAERISLDLDRHEVSVEGQPLDLSSKEYYLLRLLMLNRGHVLSRQALIEGVWGDDFMGDDKTLDVHIRWLRRKVEEDPSCPSHILTVRGTGYRFE